MPDRLTTNLIQERQELVRRAEGVKQAAVEDGGRDLVDTERTTLGNIQARIATIDEQLTITTADYALNAETAERIAKWSGGTTLPAEGHKYRTAGELMWDIIHQDDRDARERYRSHVRGLQARAAEHMGTDAANTVPVAGDLGGLVSSPITGPIIDFAWQGMPLTQALNPQQAANPLGFQRPRVVDPYLDTAAGPQAGGKEKAELPSKHFTVEADTIKLATLGNYLNVSLQLESFVAGSLDLILGQLNKRLARSIEKLTVAKIEETATTVDLAGGPLEGADVLRALFDASAMVFSATGDLAQWVAMGPAGWARLGGAATTQGEPMFSGMSATNTDSGNQPAGLRPIITPAITTADYYVGNAAALEVYLYRFPTLQAVEPSILGRQIAVAAAYGNYQAPTTEAGPGGTPAAEYAQVVKVTDTSTP